MPLVSILIFFASFIFIVSVGLNIYLIFYNKRTRIATDKFIRQVSELSPTVFKSISLRYSTTSGLRTKISPNNSCDIYLFDHFLAIVRRQDFMFKVYFTPILLTSDLTPTKNMFPYLETFKPDRITFKQHLKGEVGINLTDPIYKHYTIDIILKELTNEQISRLEKIKNWC